MVELMSLTVCVSLCRYHTVLASEWASVYTCNVYACSLDQLRMFMYAYQSKGQQASCMYECACGHERNKRKKEALAPAPSSMCAFGVMLFSPLPLGFLHTWTSIVYLCLCLAPVPPRFAWPLLFWFNYLLIPLVTFTLGASGDFVIFAAG